MPIWSFFSAAFGKDLRDAKKIFEVFGRDAHRLETSPSSSAFLRATLRQTLPISRSSCRRPASCVYSLMIFAIALRSNLDVVLFEAVFLDLFRDQMPPGDLELFFLGVTRKRDDLHTVAKRGLDRVEHVRRRHEHHVRKIERDAEIIVAKRRVLLGIEHLEQSARRVAAKIRADLVDLVEHDQRIVRPGLLDRLDDRPGIAPT